MIHLLACHQQSSRKRAEEEQLNMFLSITRRCRWGGCGKDFEGLHVSQIRAHLGKHVGGQAKVCLWRTSDKVTVCMQECLSGTLLYHLQQAHDLPIRQADAETQTFCYPCSRFVGGSQWKEHCE